MAVSFCSAVVAEIVSCSLWLPIDVIKERLQVFFGWGKILGPI
jgi:hypothetical protein